MSSANESRVIAPTYCSYASGPCDQDMTALARFESFFAYPSTPVHLSSTVAEAVRLLKVAGNSDDWRSWEELAIGGQVVFCAICKAMRGSRCVVANVTSLNFNVLFELGFAIGLRKPLLPVRDTSFETEKKLIDEIGIFDTLGYIQFANSIELRDAILNNRVYSPPVLSDPPLNKRQPIYYIRSPIDTDGSIRLFSILKKCYFKFRTFDPREVSRISLHDAFREIRGSIGVIAHLLDPGRNGAIVHNAKSAFLAGMALASGKHVLLLQEGLFSTPVDYRDVVIPYTRADDITVHVERFIGNVAETFQSLEAAQVPLPKGLLERIDLGDIAAENETPYLGTYFVKTPQFQQARQGHARLVIGRKGTGKTALFYGIRSQYTPRSGSLVLDLKPEGHQFTRLREKVLKDFSEGLQQHTLTAFWHYILLVEIANKLLDQESSTAWRDPRTLEDHRRFQAEYERHSFGTGDFSERLMALVDRVVDGLSGADVGKILTQNITDIIYKADIQELIGLVSRHLATRGGIVILFDNIDKGFPTHGLHAEDAAIIRCLLEASRKLQSSFEKRRISCHIVVFVRRDVYDRLVDYTPDRGKETSVSLDWSDTELLKELLLKRIRYQAPELEGEFDEVWARLFTTHINGESSLSYILQRTFLRPRDVLNFVRKCIQIAVSRGHEKVQAEDIQIAEREFSEDMLNDLRFEMRDTLPDFPDIILAFIGCPAKVKTGEVQTLLEAANVDDTKVKVVTDSLLWFGFLGIVDGAAEVYSYSVSYSMLKMEAILKGIAPNEAVFCVHPAFRHALSITH